MAPIDELLRKIPEAAEDRLKIRQRKCHSKRRHACAWAVTRRYGGGG